MSSPRVTPALALLPLIGGLGIAACFLEVPELAAGSPTSGGAGGAPTTSSGGAGATGGAAVCPAGLGDCDEDGTCETDLTSDADNCNRCGRACPMTTCEASQCAPVALFDDENHPHLVVRNGEYLYVTVGGGGDDGAITGIGHGKVKRAHRHGGEVIDLVTDANKPRGIAYHEGWVYWADGADGTVHRVPADGTGDDEVIHPGPDVDLCALPNGDPCVFNPGYGEAGIAVDPARNRVYWTFSAAGLILGADAMTGADLQVLAEGTPAIQIAVVGDYVYWSAPEAGGGLERRHVDRGSVLQNIEGDPRIANLELSWGIVKYPNEGRIDDELFWREGKYSGGGRIVRYAPASGTLVGTAASETTNAAGGVATDGEILVWTVPQTGGTGLIESAAMDGTDRQILNQEQYYPWGIAVDPAGEPFVYWTARDDKAHGALYRGVK